MVDSLSRYAKWRADLSRSSSREESVRWTKSDEEKERLRYATLKDDLTRAPDGSYPKEMQDGNSTFQINTTSRNQYKAPPLEVNNPLSLSDNNPWHSYFASLSMLDQIKIDVQRAFPEDEDLRTDLAQQQLTRIVFVWSLIKDNTGVGYRQGMHEIAAVCWLVRRQEQKEDQAYVEADTFVLFELIMSRVRPWYEWKSQVKFPISKRCDNIQSLLFSTDARVADHLESIGIEIQLFAIRWLRLLFTRELSLAMALEIWDALFSLDPSLELIDALCVAMIIRIRTQLLNCDYSSAFQALLHYPTYALECSPMTLIRQAQDVQSLPNQMTLMNLIQENEEMLEIPLSTSELSNSSTTSPQTYSTSSFSASVPPSLSHLTRGVYAQTLSAGFGRALYNVQRTVNAAYTAHSSNHGANDGFPASIESIHRPMQSSREMGEIEELKQKNKVIGSSLVRVIDVLEKHWSDSHMTKKEEEQQQQQQQQDSTAQDEIDFLLCLTTLKHSKDVLLGITSDYDPSMMNGPNGGEKSKSIGKSNDQKARDFGQRFKRTVEVDQQLHPTSSSPSLKNAGTPTLASPPSSTLQSISPHPKAPLAKKPVNDPLGVLIS